MSDYYKERFGWETYETDAGYSNWSVEAPFLKIHNFFVRREFRHSSAGLRMFNLVKEYGKAQGATHIWTQVVMTDRGASRSLRANLALGFEVAEAHNNVITLIRKILI